MSGLLRTLLLGDIGNYWHTSELEKSLSNLRGQTNLKKKLDEEQSETIIELEFLMAELLVMLSEKNILSAEEIANLIVNAESNSKETMEKYKSSLIPSLKRK